MFSPVMGSPSAGRFARLEVGSNANDLALLPAIDIPVLVQNIGGIYDERVLGQLPGVQRAFRVAIIGCPGFLTLCPSPSRREA